MKVVTFFVLLLVLFAYAFIGGVIFRAIEINHEDYVKVEANSTLNRVLESNTCLNVSDIVELEHIVVEMDANGVFLLNNGTSHFRPGFGIRSSILIACGLYAGFGIKNDVPATVGGKIFSIFYSIFTGFYFYFVICVMQDLFDIILQFIYYKMTLRIKGRILKWYSYFRQLFFSIIGAIFFIIIPAAIVNSIEYWSYGDSLFFCFVYVSKIGFGDFSPGTAEVKGQSEDFIEWYKMFVGFWLLISIMLFSIIIYQFNSYVSSFAWRTTDNIIDTGMDGVRDTFAKNRLWKSTTRRINQLRPLPPLPKIPPPPSLSSPASLSSPRPKAFALPPLPPLSSSLSSPQTKTLPPLPALPSLLSSSSSPLPSSLSLPPSTSSSSLNSSGTSRTILSDQITFPHIPNFSMMPQESSGDVSVIRF